MRHTDRDVLRMAGHLLEDPKRRVMASLVANAEGVSLNSVTEPEACRWCLVGAIAACREVLLGDNTPVLSRGGGRIFALARRHLDVGDLVVAWVLRENQEEIVKRLKAA
jgi:hypothetical protein